MKNANLPKETVVWVWDPTAHSKCSLCVKKYKEHVTLKSQVLFSLSRQKAGEALMYSIKFSGPCKLE